MPAGASRERSLICRFLLIEMTNLLINKPLKGIFKLMRKIDSPGDEVYQSPGDRKLAMERLDEEESDFLTLLRLMRIRPELKENVSHSAKPS